MSLRTATKKQNLLTRIPSPIHLWTRVERLKTEAAILFQHGIIQKLHAQAHPPRYLGMLPTVYLSIIITPS